MKIKLITLNTKNTLLHIFMIVMLMSVELSVYGATAISFRRVETSAGLSDNQVNCIFKDKSGFVWFGTGMGLNRFDGFRFRNFYQNSADSTSLRSNLVTQIVQSADGNMWIHTDDGYCIYNPIREQFERQPERWMLENGMTGQPDMVFVDHKGNLVIVAANVGCWYKDIKTSQVTLFTFGDGEGQIPEGNISDIAERGNSLVLTYSDGRLLRIDPSTEKVVWLNDWAMRALNGNGNQGYFTFIDNQYNYYVYTNGHTFVYSSRVKRWFDDIAEFLSFCGITNYGSQFLVKDMDQDRNGNLWIATEHRGLIKVNLRNRTFENYMYDPLNPLSMPDNTVQCAYVDNDGALWAGTLRNGVAYWSQTQTRLATIPVGDICTMTEDKQGLIWMGTNDSGIVCYNPATGKSERYRREQTGLESDVVVSSLCSRDGTLWFGSYNGGLAYCKDGHFSVIKASQGGLGVNSIWSLAEDRNGNIIIGTLGAGVQLLNRRTMSFKSFNISNSPITSDYIASVNACNDGKILVGHSRNFSFIDAKTGKIENFLTTKGGEKFASRSINQIMMDSRGLIWCANMSGLNVYDPKSDSLYILSDHSQLACAVTEDKHGNVWVSLSHGVTRFNVKRDNNGYEFLSTSYDELDGLQSRRFNYRSILTTRSGDIYIGGQDGVNIIRSNMTSAASAHAKAIFSGIILFDRPLNVGEKYAGHVVLDKAINSSRSLELNYSENAFTILLASDHVSVPQKVRFLYRLEGFNNEKWLITSSGQSTITYTNLSPGKYTLMVRVVNRDGTISPETSSLNIIISPPFWLTGWAYLIYALLIALVIWGIWRVTIRRKIVQLRIEQIQKEAERNRKLDEMKLNFFANVSHELRSPLALIISPMKALLRKETDDTKRTMYGMILRNANRLLDLVNQTLDLGRIDNNKVELNLGNGDIVKFTSDICRTFKMLSGRNVDIVFASELSLLAMSFDDDKMEKIITNLIANALKFTPDGGRICVGLTLKKVHDNNGEAINESVEITVADTGSGISNDDKKRIFERFYQARNNEGRMIGGSGIGLNLVKEFSVLHGGDVQVSDNPGGGTVFTITLPYRFNPSLPSIRTDVMQEQAEATAEQGVPFAGNERKDTDDVAISSMNSLLKKGEYEVLVVDDTQDFLDFISSELSEIYKVRTAHNGREALRMINEHRPDIILSDVMMPEMDGNELCRTLKANPKTERIPFVMLTARLSLDYKLEGLTNGADDYIAKPFNIDLLNLRIANLIKWHNATPVGEKIDPKIKSEAITSVDEKLVQQATKFVEDNLTNPELSVESMSEELSMSRVHLYKRLLSITGSTPTEFIRTIRLRHAALLLHDGQLNVSEVAYKVGFNNPRYFSKYFKDMYGVMPSQYKKTGEENKD